MTPRAHDRTMTVNETAAEMDFTTRHQGAASSLEQSATISEFALVNGKTNTSLTETLQRWSGALIWPLMLTLPLLLSSPHSFTSYQQLFPAEWYAFDSMNASEFSPKPIGLVLGILAVAIGQVFLWVFFYLFRNGYLGRVVSIQTTGARPYTFGEGLSTHIAQPEGFGLLVGYLSLTWMYGLMPKSYYSFDGCIQWELLLVCLVVQDGIQFVMHLLEHFVSPSFYQMSHKPHHRFTNPRLFDAFNGSVVDTICMIIIPLFATANIVRTSNVWTYMAFGSTYSGWLTLIHSEYVFPWDRVFRTLGLGTPADHHVHHKFFKFNYGHLFMWFDQVCGTYQDPSKFAPKVFNANV
jgi:sterol desaturase/sphingolipid hydroxylase (fatty acid hydroxylase superfamily)